MSEIFDPNNPNVQSLLVKEDANFDKNQKMKLLDNEVLAYLQEKFGSCIIVVADDEGTNSIAWAKDEKLFYSMIATLNIGLISSRKEAGAEIHEQKMTKQ